MKIFYVTLLAIGFFFGLPASVFAGHSVCGSLVDGQTLASLNPPPNWKLCDDGTPRDFVFNPGIAQWTWWCEPGWSENPIDYCYANKAGAVVGQCNTDVAKHYSWFESVFPGGEPFCEKGDLGGSDPDFPDKGLSSTWTCLGQNGGGNASCAASRGNDPVLLICPSSRILVVGGGPEQFQARLFSDPIGTETCESPIFLDVTNDTATTWSVTGPSFVTVSSGLVTPVAEGMSTIGATHTLFGSNFDAEADVQVQSPPVFVLCWSCEEGGVCSSNNHLGNSCPADEFSSLDSCRSFCSKPYWNEVTP